MSFDELVADVLTNYAVAWQGSDGAECFGIAMELFNLIEQHVAEEVARETERCADAARKWEDDYVMDDCAPEHVDVAIRARAEK